MTGPVRRAQIIRLLETRDDHLPLPSRRDYPPAGFVHHTVVRESCPDCLANDRTIPGCETCGGRGYVETVRDRDPYAVEKVQPYGMSNDRHERRRDRDNEIARLDRQLAEPWKTPADELADANRHPEGWELERERKWRDYDYGALDLALDALRLNDQGAYQLLHSVYVYGYLPVSGDGVASACERGLAFLDARMPNPIRVPGDEPVGDVKTSLWRGRSEQHRRARARRAERVLRAHLEWGWSTAQVASHESLTDRRVRQIVEQHRGLIEMASCATGPAA